MGDIPHAFSWWEYFSAERKDDAEERRDQPSLREVKEEQDPVHKLGGWGEVVGKSHATAGKAEDVDPDVGNSVDLVEFNFADKKKK